MGIRVIVEFRAQRGKRAALEALLDRLVAEHGPSSPGFLSSTRYEVLGDPDMLVELAEWESAEARAVHLKEVAATGAYAPVVELLAAPIRATVVRALP